MRPREIELGCPAALAVELAGALRAYAEAAYPPGGSECAQVAREALLDTANSIDAATAGVIRLPRRQLPLLRAAVTWYFDAADPGRAALGQALQGLLAKP